MTIPTDTTQFIVTAVQTNHKELIWNLKEVLYVEADLRQKIITAVMQPIKQIQKIMAQIQPQINNTNEAEETTTKLVAKKDKKAIFWRQLY